MKLEVINPETMTLAEIISSGKDLFYIVNGSVHKYKLQSLADSGISVEGDYILVKITDEDEEIIETVDESKEEEKPQRFYGNRNVTSLTYKFFGNDPTESIFVEFRPENSGIRVSFNDKESAQAYFEYFREQFYTSTTGASVITVSNIYKDLNLVNWDPDDCDDWGWYTLDSGTCRYITEVRKNKNSKRFGFTLTKPTKLYESKRKESA